MNKIIENLNWRYATKIFDKNKKINKEDLETILESFRLTPSSFWLQPWKLIIVENPELREKLVEASWWQRQVAEASHLLVFTKYNDFWNKNVENYIENTIETRWWEKKDLDWFENMMKWFLKNLSPEQKANWEEKQVYIALWNLMTTCAIIWIDSCPMEWFVREKFDEILWLNEKWLSSVVLLPIGYRDEENDKYAKAKKVRYNKEKLVEYI